MTTVTVSTTGDEVIGQRYVGTTETPIVAAIDYLITKGGGSCFIEAGIYTISSSIFLDSNIEIYGEGRHTILRNNTPSSAVIQIYADSIETLKTNIYMHDLLIGNNEDTVIGSYGLIATGVGHRGEEVYARDAIIQEGLRIENCIFLNNQLQAIRLGICDNFTLKGNVIHNNKGIEASNALLILSSSRGRVQYNCITNNYGGVYMEDSNHIEFTGNFVQNNVGYGLNLSTTELSILTGNIIQNNGNSGIISSESYHNNISSNTISNNILNGIVIYSSDENIISANTLQNNSEFGMMLSDSHKNKIMGNTCSANDSRGIVLHNSNNNNLTGNTVSRNKAMDITLTNSNDNLVVSNIYQSASFSGTDNITSLNIQN